MAADQVTYLDQVRDIPSSGQPGNTPPPHSWRPASLIDLAANPPAPPCIGGLLYPGKRTVLSGETESMKTWLALILAKAELDAGHPVTWIDLDAMGPGAMLQRLQLLGVPDGQIHDGFHYIQPSETLDPPKIDELQAQLAATATRLCVIDAFNPILSLHGLEPNSTPDIETFWRTIADPICDAGAAPVLLDHVVKNAEGRGKYAYGSERKASGAIVHLGFRLLEPLTKGGKGRSLLTVHKDRPGYLPRPTLGRLTLDASDAEIVYTIEPDISHQTDRFRPTILMEKVSEYLERYGQAVSRNTIETDVVGKRDGIRTAIQVLIDEGYVGQKQGPRRAHLYTHIRPYREASDQPQTTSPPLRPHFAPNLRSVEETTSPHPHPYRGGGEVVSTTSPPGEDDFAPTLTDYDLPPIPYDLEPHPDELEQ